MCRTYNRHNGRTKRCPKCGLIKVLDSFSKVRKTGRIYSYCKACESDKSRSLEKRIKKHEYYLKNKDKKIAQSKMWVLKNRKKHAKYVMLYKLRRKYEGISLDCSSYRF